jgi:hypothetical protein
MYKNRIRAEGPNYNYAAIIEFGIKNSSDLQSFGERDDSQPGASPQAGIGRTFGPKKICNE